LDALANAYGKSRLGFLPMPLKTAMIYAKDKDIEKAKTAYEGNDHLMGEVRDMSLERIYPEFDALIHDPQVLSTWVETFEPFWSWFQLQPKPEHYESVGSEQMGEEESEL
jgi:exonuclease V gamma subunit